MSMNAKSYMVEVHNLSMEFVRQDRQFGQRKQRIRAIDDVSLKIIRGETMGVGASPAVVRQHLGAACFAF